jgi:hypothetical protein
VLEPGLCVGVGAKRRLRSVPLRHPRLEALQLGFDLEDPVEAGGDVLAQSRVVAGRALVVKGDPSATLEGDRARVEAGFAGDDSQQRRLAAAVAARERHPVAALELERDVAEESAGADVLRQS